MRDAVKFINQLASLTPQGLRLTSEHARIIAGNYPLHVTGDSGMMRDLFGNCVRGGGGGNGDGDSS